MNFLGIPDEDARYDDCAGVVVPVPYERTVSYGGGTARGPQAILEASGYVELYDEVLREEPYKNGGIHTAAAVVPGEDEDAPAFLDRLAGVATALFADGRFPIFLGGEHTITSRAVDAQGNVQPAMDDPRIAKKKTYWESKGQIARQIRIA